MMRSAHRLLLRLLPVVTGLILLSLMDAGWSQSVFSARGIGEVQASPGARLAGMGGAGTAIRDSLILTIANPASPASINRTRVAVSGAYQWILVTDNLTSDPRDYADFQGVALAIPFYNHWTFSAGVDPYSIARSSWFWARQFNNLGYEEQYRVSGGFSRILLGISFPIHSRLQLGGGVRMLFGTLDQTFTINFVSSLYRDAQYVNRLNSKSIGATGGMVWEFVTGWSVGGFYYSKQRGDATLKFSYVDSDSVRTTNGSLEFPASIGAGFCGTVKPRVRIAGDMLLTRWQDATIAIDQDLPTADTWKISVGAEYQPLYGGLESFYNRLYYRIGFSTENLYLKNELGDTPRLTMVHAGLGIPLKTADRRIDIAISWGIRGNVADFGAKETLFGLSFTLESAENWFVRRK